MGLFARAMYGIVSRFGVVGGLAKESAQPDDSEGGRARRRAGRWGEQLAYWFLRREGYIVIRRNFRVFGRPGDIDLIAWDGPVLVFVEVKTRTTATGNEPEDSVTFDQRRNLEASAVSYLKRRRLPDVPYRFDVVAVDARAGRRPVVRLYRDAFAA